MKAYIIGSIKQINAIELTADKLSKMGFEVRHVKPSDDKLSDLIRSCYLHIETWADIVVVVPKSLSPEFIVGDDEMINFGPGTLYLDGEKLGDFSGIEHVEETREDVEQEEDKE